MPAAQILLVEDNSIVADIIESSLTEKGFRVLTVYDGEVAWNLIREGLPELEAVVLDGDLPSMNGMDVLRGLKSLPAYARVPVIMETSTDDPQSIREGIDAGAYYYLTKPFEVDVLLAVVQAAVAEFRTWQNLRKSLETAEHAFTFLESCHFRIRTVRDAYVLSESLSKIHPGLERTAIGLLELMVNGIEHGNLGITYAEKGQLILEERLQEELERRLALPENQAKFVDVRCERLPDQFRFTIRDQGSGFAWERYLEIDLDRAFDPHGRGIAMARKLSFDNLEFQGNGNTVVATTRT